MVGYVAQPRYSSKGLGPSPKHCALPSLRNGWGCGGRARWRRLEEGRVWDWDWNVK